jgi:WhiB family redox-sensing transcriptional regulator
MKIDLNLADAEMWVDAVCSQIDPELFFDLRTEKQAVDVCIGCPLMQKCGEYALKNQVEYGVWGGLTEKQRLAMQKALAKKKTIK